MKKTRFSAFLVCLAVQAIASCPNFGHAEPPPSSNAEQAEGRPNSLADRHAIVGRQEIHPKDLPFFNSDIRPNLDLASQVPGLGKLFEEVLNKNWVTTKNGLEFCRDPETVTVRGKKVACQTPTQVIINDNWWNDVEPAHMPIDKANAMRKQKQLDLVRHAFCVGIVLNTKGRTETEDLYDCFDVLTQVPTPSAEKLRDAVTRMGYLFNKDCSTSQPEVATAQLESLRNSLAPVLKQSGRMQVEYISYESSGGSTNVKVPTSGGETPSVMVMNGGTFATGAAARNLSASHSEPNAQYLKAVTEMIKSGAVTPENITAVLKLLRESPGQN